MEVMIAATILALAAISTMTVLSGSRSTLLRAEQRWAQQHLMSQLAEIYLLGGVNVELPDGLLPDGFSSSCSVYQVEDGIHEEALEDINGWILCEYHIELYDAGGNLLGQSNVRKVLKEDDVE